MIEWIFTMLVFYLLYKLVFDFILPVAKASSQVKNNINRMDKPQPPQSKQQYSNVKPGKEHPSSNDYIDFEEVKTK